MMIENEKCIIGRKKRKSMNYIVFILLLWPFYLFSQVNNPDTVTDGIDPSGTVNYKARLTTVSVTASALYAGTVTGLYFLWYADYPKSSFHFFNDCGQWLSMDKAGHIVTSYWVGRIGHESLRWSGVDRKKAIWYGGTWGLAYLTAVEIFDGFSAEWGASGGDMAANTLGTAIFIGQQLIWDDQPFTFKYSFHPTEYADYRPDLLGENFIQQMLKDYNGQTYWLSGNISFFLPETSRFPKWLDFSLGYSGEGMLGADSNPGEYNGEPLPYFERYSQYYLSLDIDLTKIRTRNETVRLLLNLIGYVKIPFPAVEFNRIDKVKWHWIYY
jgi:hypothetical protein